MLVRGTHAKGDNMLSRHPAFPTRCTRRAVRAICATRRKKMRLRQAPALTASVQLPTEYSGIVFDSILSPLALLSTIIAGDIPADIRPSIQPN